MVHPHIKQQARNVEPGRVEARFSDLLDVLSARFARIPHHEIDAEIEHWLEEVCRCLKLDRSVIGEYSPDTGDFRAIYQWTRDGFPRAPMMAASEAMPWTSHRVRSGETVATRSAASLPPEAERDREWMLAPAGPRARIALPLIIGGRVVAGITFADLHGERAWPPLLVRRLRLVADIFANALERKRLAVETVKLADEMRQATRLTLMSETSAAVAHELSHPLSAILANAQAARRMLESPTPQLSELKDMLDDVISAERRAAMFLEKVRSLFKKSGLHIESLHVSKLVEAVASLVRGEMVAKGISLQIRIQDGLPMVAADRVGIEQVILNLIRNAAEAVSESENAVRRVMVCASQPRSRRVEIAVEDTGRGIDKQEMGKIFEPLFTTKATGMGMGLAIVRSILEAHGAEIEVRSEPGSGTTFQFALPVAGGS